jgi:hypothetical protein
MGRERGWGCEGVDGVGGRRGEGVRWGEVAI